MSSSDGADQARALNLIAELDRLIELMIKEITQQISKHAKLGDFIRMVELRYKLLPDNSSQKDFWKMMEKIRQEKLPSGGVKQSGREKHASDKREAS